MNQPKLIWGCKGKGMELIRKVFKRINSIKMGFIKDFI